MKEGKTIVITTLCVVCDGDLLLVQRSNNPFAWTRWIPWGKLEQWEAITTWLLREIKEELGFIPYNLEPLPYFEFSDYGHIIVFPFISRIACKNDIKINPAINEIKQWAWYPLEDIKMNTLDLEWTPNHMEVIKAI